MMILILMKKNDHDVPAFPEQPVVPLEEADTGDFILFGRYPQNENPEDRQSITWRVLEKKDNRLLVISECGLDCLPYQEEFEEVVWGNCTLRKWLNDDFLHQAFSVEELAMIPSVTVNADENPENSTDPGNPTEDKEFLLSIPEAERYFKDDRDRLCRPTEYATGKGCDTVGEKCSWWL